MQKNQNIEKITFKVVHLQYVHDCGAFTHKN